MNIKKGIAKEGLILLGVAALGLAVYFTGKHLNASYLQEHAAARFKVMYNMRYSLVGYIPYLRIESFGLSIAIFGYPVIALIRFIYWSFKTLKR